MIVRRLVLVLLVSVWASGCGAPPPAAAPFPAGTTTLATTPLPNTAATQAGAARLPTQQPSSTPRPTLALAATDTPAPTATPSSTRTPPPMDTVHPTDMVLSTDADEPTETPIPTCVHGLSYVGDVTIPDDTKLGPGEAFAKTWAVQNKGTCAWDETLGLILVSGEPMSAPTSVPVPPAAPGAVVELSVALVAPQEPGRYRGVWQLCGHEGCLPGAITVQIIVGGPEDVPGPGSLRLGEVFYDGEEPKTEGDEYVEIINGSEKPLNVRGWLLRDDDGNVFAFPDFIMEPGQACRVYTNQVYAESCGFSFGNAQAIWGNSGDVVELVDPSGRIVDRRCWGRQQAECG